MEIDLDPIAPILFTPPPAAPCCEELPLWKTLASYVNSFYECTADARAVWTQNITRIFCDAPNPAANEPPIAPAALTLQAKRADRIARRATYRKELYTDIRTKAVEALHNVTLRKTSLLNAASKLERPLRNTPDALKNVRKQLEWRGTPITDYPQLAQLDPTPEQQEALRGFARSEATLQTQCDRDLYADPNGRSPKPGPVTHAEAFFIELSTLRAKPDGTVARFSGALGKKQFLLQRLLAQGKAGAEYVKQLLPQQHADEANAGPVLPPELADAIDHDIAASPQALLAYGLDQALLARGFDQALLAYGLEQLLNSICPRNTGAVNQNNNDAVNQDVEANHPPHVVNQNEEEADRSPVHILKKAALATLKILLPDENRRIPGFGSLKERLPCFFASTDKDPVQQGLLLHLIDLIPNSHAALRDECIDLVENLARGIPAARMEECIQRWKFFIAKHAASLAPNALLESINGEWEESLASLLQQIDPALNDVVTGMLYSYGNYFLEGTYDSDTDTYSLTLYPSGALLTHPDYPRIQGRPVWPIQIHHIDRYDLTSEALSVLLEKMSTTTAITRGWKSAQDVDPSFTPLTADDLFGAKGSLLALLSRIGGRCDYASTIAPAGALLSQEDLVSYFCSPKKQPNEMRYKALRQTLLEAAAPFAKVSHEDQLPHLALPQGDEGDGILNLFQTAADALHHLAKHAPVDEEDLNEITAFQKQLELTHEARLSHLALTMPHSHDPEEGLGMLVDAFLKICSSSDDLHVLVECRSLLIFLFGEHSKHFVDRLCARAQQLQADAQRAPPQSLFGKAAAWSNTYIPHHEGTWIRKSLNSTPAHIAFGCAQVLWHFAKALYHLISHLISALVPDDVKMQARTLLRTIREKIFALLFPQLAGTTVLKTVHDQLEKLFPEMLAREVPSAEALTHALRQQAEDPDILARLHSQAVYANEQAETAYELEQQAPGDEALKQQADEARKLVQQATDAVKQQQEAMNALEQQIEKWRMPYMHFCPLADMKIAADPAGNPLLHMTPFKLKFTPVETVEGGRWGNLEAFPGFWIALEQNVPFGLVLENAAGEQKLLLPSQTLHFQALYAGVSPMLGILGPILQSQLKLPAGNQPYFYYTRTQDRSEQWVSESPFAMAHLMLLSLAYQTTHTATQLVTRLVHLQRPNPLRNYLAQQEMQRAGEHFINMHFNPDVDLEKIELYLLPLLLTLDRGTHKLYGRLIAKLESVQQTRQAQALQEAQENQAQQEANAEAPPALPTLPEPAAKLPQGTLIALANVYKTLVMTRREDLDSSTLEILHTRYKRLLSTCIDELTPVLEPHVQATLSHNSVRALCEQRHVKALLSNDSARSLFRHTYTTLRRVDWVATMAIQSLPLTVQSRLYAVQYNNHMALSRGNLGASFLRYLRASPIQIPFIHKLVTHILSSQHDSSRFLSVIGQMSTFFLDGRIVRTIPSLAPPRVANLSAEDLMNIAAQMQPHPAQQPDQAALIPFAPLEPLAESLVPHFFTHLDTALGKNGSGAKRALVENLLAHHWSTKGPMQHIGTLLLTAAAYEKQYLVFSQIQNKLMGRNGVLAPLETLTTLVLFNKLQPIFGVVQAIMTNVASITASSIAMSFVAKRLVLGVVKYLAPFGDHNKTGALRTSLILGIFTSLLHGSNALNNLEVPKRYAGPLSLFNRLTGASLNFRSLFAFTNAALAVFSTQCFAYHSAIRTNRRFSMYNLGLMKFYCLKFALHCITQHLPHKSLMLADTLQLKQKWLALK